MELAKRSDIWTYLEQSALGLKYRPDGSGDGCLFETVGQPPVLYDAENAAGRVGQIIERIHQHPV